MEKILSKDEIMEIKEKSARNFDNNRVQDPHFFYHLYKGDKMGVCFLTGWDKKKDLKPSDVLVIQEKAYTINDVTYRSHRGVWENPQDAKGTFFQVNMTFFADLTSPR